MAYANITYTGNGTNRNFTIPFQYLLKDHVFVYVGGALTTAYTYVTANTIQLDVAPANGVTVLIKRVTPIDTPIVDYVDGSTLQESLLDATALQNLFASQEAFDAASLLVLALDGVIDAANKRIKNVATPVAGNDAVTKDYVDVTIPANLAAAAASAAAAANSAANAGNYAVAALNSKNAAAVSETNAAASADTAAAVVASKVDKTADTGSVKVPVGTTAQRDASPLTGYFRFNATLGKFEGYNGAAWGAVGGGATGGGSDAVFVENNTTITADYTITTGKNAMTAGPITINNGVTVTVPNGSVWTVI